ncbi:2'-5' RNA ligase [Roseivivax halodurans JCM 10272]|uniref:RNA 2',3'-cyclic phosphodiesterase n=1 Tax=Roseivivax halodurans JCM 10272 TaxID=1449350 RepID=X7EGZ9_9RHOB|nr:RNA 2',3'-cyclic phosphodiesterase [Roseivivax halodurans]ETX15212.1 2'-5' RNA ligase [Roseivivax halodurans JCM 10272]
MRAFIALPLPPSDADVLEAMGDRLGFGRVIPSENVHLTLAFLGDVPEADLAEIAEGLESLSPAAFTYRLSGVRSFGNSHGGHALAMGAEGGAPLKDLHDRVRSRLYGAGMPLERRRFRPHVTFARLPGRLTIEEEGKLKAFLEREAHMAIEDIPADRFTLYESILTKDGSVYEPLVEYPLAPPG